MPHLVDLTLVALRLFGLLPLEQLMLGLELPLRLWIFVTHGRSRLKVLRLRLEAGDGGKRRPKQGCSVVPSPGWEKRQPGGGAASPRPLRKPIRSESLRRGSMPLICPFPGASWPASKRSRRERATLPLHPLPFFAERLVFRKNIAEALQIRAGSLNRHPSSSARAAHIPALKAEHQIMVAPVLV